MDCGAPRMRGSQARGPEDGAKGLCCPCSSAEAPEATSGPMSLWDTQDVISFPRVKLDTGWGMVTKLSVTDTTQRSSRSTGQSRTEFIGQGHNWAQG